MALTKQQKLQVFRIIEEAEEGVNLNRIIDGTLKDVIRGSGSSPEFGYDKVEASKEEIRSYWQELQTKGYIIPINNYTKDWFKLSPKGKNYCERLKASQTEPLDVDLDSVIFHEQLREEIRTLFEDGEYAECVVKGARLLERLLRNKTGSPTDVKGVGLASLAFKPEEGELIAPYCQEKSHEEGFHCLYLGAIKFIRNLAIHHSETLNDQIDNLQMLIFLDLLFRLLEKSKPRKP
ncbi:TIGR02391 family protein [candidate division TA06 bacterium B3_TA06]|uniref:TIGR02391 family protein n=1 Tax=candidate division TA06 bacterium B3_TA06 TaxID=2012487 RepID=A0A532V9R8_UNCT6|nr:MAG: TIGR02391 family protein [candidate division TA06 bacterium B3_TA06]